MTITKDKNNILFYITVFVAGLITGVSGIICGHFIGMALFQEAGAYYGGNIGLFLFAIVFAKPAIRFVKQIFNI